MSTRASLTGDHARAIAVAQESQAISEQLGRVEGTSEALSVIGLHRVYAGEGDGIADLERAVELARGSSAGAVARVVNSLAVAYQVAGDLELAYRTRLESLRSAERIGSDSLLRWFAGVLADHHYRRGEWTEAMSMADDLLRGVEAGTPTVAAWQVYGVRAEMRLARGDLPGAVADADAGLASGRQIDEVQAICFALAVAAHVLSVASEPARATELAVELLDSLRSGVDMQFAIINLPLLASAARRLALGDDLAAALDGHTESPWLESARAYLGSDFVTAADILGRIGSKPDEAEARLHAAEKLLADGRVADADAQRARALAFYRSVNAAAVRELELR